MTLKLPVSTPPQPGVLTVQSIPGGGHLIAGKENVDRARVLILRSALKLEILGLRHSRGSVYALIKAEFGFKGNKQKVLDQLNKWIDDNILPPK